MGPRPPVGVHRYVLVLFEQKTRFPTSRRRRRTTAPTSTPAPSPPTTSSASRRRRLLQLPEGAVRTPPALMT
eukprot:UN05135